MTAVFAQATELRHTIDTDGYDEIDLPGAQTGLMTDFIGHDTFLNKYQTQWVCREITLSIAGA